VAFNKLLAHLVSFENLHPNNMSAQGTPIHARNFVGLTSNELRDVVHYTLMKHGSVVAAEATAAIKLWGGNGFDFAAICISDMQQVAQWADDDDYPLVLNALTFVCEEEMWLLPPELAMKLEPESEPEAESEPEPELEPETESEHEPEPESNDMEVIEDQMLVQPIVARSRYFLLRICGDYPPVFSVPVPAKFRGKELVVRQPHRVIGYVGIYKDRIWVTSIRAPDTLAGKWSTVRINVRDRVEPPALRRTSLQNLGLDDITSAPTGPPAAREAAMVAIHSAVVTTHGLAMDALCTRPNLF
jgi:hypothetical protein